MKTKIKSVIALLLVCLMMCCFAACEASLSGTYTASNGLFEQSFIFKDDNKVAVSAFGIEAEGDYVIEDGKIIITYSLLGFSYDWSETFERKGKDIIIGNTVFTKVE